MIYATCPNCGGHRIIKAPSRLFILLGALVLAASAVVYLASFCCPPDENWSNFAPLCHVDPAFLIGIVFGLLLLWGGLSQIHQGICLQCGHVWEYREHPLNRYRHQGKPLHR